MYSRTRSWSCWYVDYQLSILTTGSAIPTTPVLFFNLTSDTVVLECCRKLLWTWKSSTATICYRKQRGTTRFAIIRKLLNYWHSSIFSAGFKAIKFTITPSSSTPDKLPSASTCYSRLKLPEYTSYEQLSRKLYLAFTAGASGFMSVWVPT